MTPCSGSNIATYVELRPGSGGSSESWAGGRRGGGGGYFAHSLVWSLYSIRTPLGGGGGVLAPIFGTHCETDPDEIGGSDKQRQKSDDRPIPLNCGAVRYL